MNASRIYIAGAILAGAFFPGLVGAVPLFCESPVEHKHKDNVISCSAEGNVVSFEMPGERKGAGVIKLDKNNRSDFWVVDLHRSVDARKFDNVFGLNGGPSVIHLSAAGSRTSVPEPGTLALLAIGMLGAGFARRRRQS
ncbi:MAG TPA: PEP-CTERM sorting domain-containing protein [Steroidobacter sp.]|uniref:PEP-CTERM sorting domain-containing protein n=1 Tax=Steroidobacter sp. TaxID=1978227 RepID=UPI002ED7E230